MAYNYSELSPIQFENFVITLCHELFGIGAQSFSPGPDGGRDSRFHGIANRFPSIASPWKGLTIIQAKHTIQCRAKFSDTDFFSENSSCCEIATETDKIVKLKNNNEIDNYIIFSNRKLASMVNEKIINYISKKTGLDREKIYLVGIEKLEGWTKEFNQAIKNFQLNPFELPIFIDPNELSQVILGIKGNLQKTKKEDMENAIKRTNLKTKNKINNLTENYSKSIESKIADFVAIQDFLSRPENSYVQDLYIESADEINAKIRAYKPKDESFDKTIETIIDLVIAKDNDCNSNKRLTRIVIFYMYYKCDIGENKID